MVKLYPKKKVEIVADAAVQSVLIEIFEKAGAKGYTLVPNVSGKGHRGVREGGDIFDVFRNVYAFTIVSPDVAQVIVEEAMRRLETHARIVFVSDVDVVREEHF